MPKVSAELPSLFCILPFSPGNLLGVRRLGTKAGLAFTGSDLGMARERLHGAFPNHTPPAEYFSTVAGGRSYRVFFTQATGASLDPEIQFLSIDQLGAEPALLAPSLAAIVAGLEPHLIDIPYLHLGENDFIYKFRPGRERNPGSYAQDPVSSSLYQSKLCAAIKELSRANERTASEPVQLDFGAVSYVIPSHFGFCLGVKNAIERAYETLAENAGARVFMLSELIHNPFVNEDLLRRGLRYLQTDKSIPYTTSGSIATGTAGETLLWDTLTPEDIVIIPAFGATDEDKQRLVRKGIPVCQYDATCMLVEKVWKAARSYARKGFTVVIHGKHEHEETKATFSAARRHGPALIVRNLEETRLLGQIIASSDPAFRARFFEVFAGKYTPGFDVARHLEKIAVVNQTTLLANETRTIIDHLRDVCIRKHGPEGAQDIGSSGQADTLCYATQVNQDALGRALAGPLDAAFVIGGKNSSNTYQLFRLCEQALGAKAFFIQSEASIHTNHTVDHYLYGTSDTETRPLWSEVATPKRVLVTGGASCPDGIIQQVITRINCLFPHEQLRSVDRVLAELEKA